MSKNMKIGVTGANGQLGKLVLKALAQKKATAEIVALVRSPQNAPDLNVETRKFDYNNSECLSESLLDIEILLLISGNEFGTRVNQHKAVIEAAKEANVKHIVYTSLLHADTSTISLATDHLATENAIKASGLTYTILRNGWYTENYTASAKGAISAGAFIGCAENGKISAAARNDFAEAAATVLTSNGHENKSYELAGDKSFTLTDLANEISAQSGKKIPYNNLSESDYANILLSIGLPEGLAKLLAEADTAVTKGDLFDDSKQLSKLIGRSTTSLSDVLKEALKQ